MKKYLFLFFCLFLISGCSSDDDNIPSKPDVVYPGKAEVSITSDNMIISRSTSSRVEFTGGYATGAGLYSGSDKVTVAATPYEGYALVSFVGGPANGVSNQYKGSNRYTFDIDSQDWKFKVDFKKEYTITLNVDGSGGTVSGGGPIIDGDNCNAIATPYEGFVFDGWYQNDTKISSNANYVFVVSSNRTPLCIYA